MTTTIEDIDQIIEVVAKGLKLTGPAIFTYGALTQVAPETFKGFMGFETNLPPPITGAGGGGGKLNTQSVTVASAPFIDPSTGRNIGSGFVVIYGVTPGSSSGTVLTDSFGVASIFFPSGTIALGTYTVTFRTTVQHGPITEPLTQTVTFSVNV